MNNIVHDNPVYIIHTHGKFWIGCLILTGAFVFCFKEVFAALINAWSNNAVYSHGFLIPFISLYIVWGRRDKLRLTQLAPRYPTGLAILGIGLLLHLTGHVGGIFIIQELSLIITIIGIVILILGTEFIKILFFPITFLIFMLTSWGVLTEKLHQPFQNISAFIGTKLLHIIGIPAYRESVYIELPNVTLEVAKVCSGVNYLIAVVAIGIPLAYITLKSWQRRILLVSSALVMSVTANGVRVALIGFLSYYNMSGDLHGPYHTLHAMFVSVIGYIVLFIGAWILSDTSKPTLRRNALNTLSSTASKVLTQGSILKFPFLLTFVFLLCFGVFINLHRPLSFPPKTDIRSFPDKIGSWTMIENNNRSSVFSSLRIDHELSRIYRTVSGKGFKLDIGYLEYQEYGKKLVNNITEDLHNESFKKKIKLSSGEVIEINRATKSQGKSNQIILFFYDINGRIVADKYMAKAYTAWDALIRKNTSGAIIIVSMEMGGPMQDNNELTEEGILQILIPVIHDHVI